jgi:hypothetical protein
MVIVTIGMTTMIAVLECREDTADHSTAAMDVHLHHVLTSETPRAREAQN